MDAGGKRCARIHHLVSFVSTSHQLKWTAKWGRPRCPSYSDAVLRDFSPRQSAVAYELSMEARKHTFVLVQLLGDDYGVGHVVCIMARAFTDLEVVEQRPTYCSLVRPPS